MRRVDRVVDRVRALHGIGEVGVEITRGIARIDHAEVVTLC